MMKKLILPLAAAALIGGGSAVYAPSVSAFPAPPGVGDPDDHNLSLFTAELKNHGVQASDPPYYQNLETWICNARANGHPAQAVITQLASVGDLSHDQAVTAVSSAMWHFCSAYYEAVF
jgi:hypothetical protein